MYSSNPKLTKIKNSDGCMNGNDTLYISPEEWFKHLKCLIRIQNQKVSKEQINSIIGSLENNKCKTDLTEFDLPFTIVAVLKSKYRQRA